MRTPLGSRWEVFFDLIATVTFAVAVAQILLGDVTMGDTIARVALLVIAGVLVGLRRRFPIGAALGSIATSVLALFVPGSALAVWVLAEVCLFTLPLRRSRAWATAAGVMHAVVLYVGAMAAFGVGALDPMALILPVWTGAVVAFGIALRAQQDYVAAVEEKARTAAEVRESEVLRHVGQEHLRIARDLHDSVANSIAVISLHAATAERHVIDDPERARVAMATVRRVGKSSLEELAGILTVLRRDDSGIDTDRTVATIPNIPHLVEILQASGLVVQPEVDDLNGVRLDPASDAAVYRVVQEALTNAHRHGRGPVRLRIHSRDGTVIVTVANAVTPALSVSGSGYGLIGMRERVELAGGTVTVEHADDMFTVTAEFPILPDTGGLQS
jgi:signal transduction histidine kinase